MDAVRPRAVAAARVAPVRAHVATPGVAPSHSPSTRPPHGVASRSRWSKTALFQSRLAHAGYVALVPDLYRGKKTVLATLVRLLDTTLVHWGGEMGRLPVIQNDTGADNVGRDHNTHGFSMWLAGGGVKGGRVVGSSDPIGAVPADRPVEPADVVRGEGDRIRGGRWSQALGAGHRRRQRRERFARPREPPSPRKFFCACWPFSRP